MGRGAAPEHPSTRICAQGCREHAPPVGREGWLEAEAPPRAEPAARLTSQAPFLPLPPPGAAAGPGTRVRPQTPPHASWHAAPSAPEPRQRSGSITPSPTSCVRALEPDAQGSGCCLTLHWVLQPRSPPLPFPSPPPQLPKAPPLPACKSPDWAPELPHPDSSPSSPSFQSA